MAKRTDRIRVAGGARICSEVPVSDGTTANEILGFWMDETGVLDSTFRLMPLIPSEWRGSDPPEPFVRGVLAMCFTLTRSGVPELLFLTEPASDGSTGSVWRYAPWRRADGGDQPGLEEIFQYSGTTQTPLLAGKFRATPPCMLAVGNRVYFTFGDGSGVWVTDFARVRPVGYTLPPGSPLVDGPCRDDAGNPNDGGFSVRGRISASESSWTDTSGAIIGGTDRVERYYAVVFEGPDGGYSPTSPLGDAFYMDIQLADPTATPPVYESDLGKRAGIMIGVGPSPTQARIVLCTPNLKRLPAGDDGSLRFHSRIGNNEATELISDLPDGELGSQWKHRAAFPPGIEYVQHYNGSNFYIKGARVWWSEQEEAGPILDSILAAAWMDVYPQTGDITAAFPVRMHTPQEIPVMLMLKAGAVHFISGSYPLWQRGTLHARAGCAGWNLIQSLPDGSTLWAGAGTFWRLGEDGGIDDVGGGIRKRLRRVNWLEAKKGTSWVDRVHGEAAFVLPTYDSQEPNYQFIWDFRLNGFRFREDLQIDFAVTLGDTDIVAAAGSYGGSNNVFLYGRGYPGFSANPPTWRYVTGWVTLVPDNMPNSMAASSTDSVWLLEERLEASATVHAYRNWNFDDYETTLSLRMYVPDADAVAFYYPTATPATYGASKWRERRIYNHRLQVDVDSAQVIALEATGTDAIALAGIDLFGPIVASAGVRSSEADA